MKWHRRYGIKSYVKSALWIVPFIAILIDWVLICLTNRIDTWLGWTFLGLSTQGAQLLCQTILSITISFIVFTSGSLLVAIQVASGQMTPRVIATILLRDNILRYTIGLFVLTILFTLRAANTMGATVNQFAIFATALLGLASLVAFLFLIDYVARLLRPGSIVWRVAESGLEVIKSVYPHLVAVVHQQGEEAGRRISPPDRVVCHQGRSGTVLAVNLEALLGEAQKSNGIIEFSPHVGDFVATEAPLFLLYGGASDIDDHKLHASVAIGSERTMDQDPMFAFRILLDIALKALSPAINDPTTAVLAIDQLHRMLRSLGKRRLSSEEILDTDGQLRVIMRTPNWPDYVHLTFTELRFCGASSIQVARRLRAMIENLVHNLPEHRHPALFQELDLLDRTLEKDYIFPEDLALARIPDSQGLGGSIRSEDC